MFDTDDAESSLLDYLYQSPLCLVVTDAQGLVELMTPVAAQLLMPLSRNGRLDNLFHILRGSLPQLGQLATEAKSNMVCENLQFPVRFNNQERVMSLTVNRVAAKKLLISMTDVTEQVLQYQREQQLAQRNMQTVMEALPTMVGLWDTKLINQFANPAYARWFSKESAQLKGMALGELIGTERLANAMSSIDNVMRGHPQMLERETPSPDGRGTRFTVVHLLPNFQNGKVQGFYELINDVTATRSAQLALAASESLLHRAGGLAKVGAWAIDLGTRAVFWSQQTRVLYEVDDNFEPTMESMVAFHQSEFAASLEQSIAEAVSSGRSWDLELPLTTARGQHIWVRSLGEVEYDAGRPTRLVGTIQDITTRKDTENELRVASIQAKAAIR